MEVDLSITFIEILNSLNKSIIDIVQDQIPTSNCNSILLRNKFLYQSNFPIEIQIDELFKESEIKILENIKKQYMSEHYEQMK
jgi:hypothetical protein